ncbi:MAG: MarR family transcriptional regulator [bacterium]|nr:MarR family transcriptional regulator [bacterium]
MVQATTPTPAAYFADVARTRALFTDAAESATIASVLGSLIDFMSTLRQRHADTTGTTMALTRLAAHGPMRSADLATSLNLDQSTVSRQVATLESEGLVERVPVPDDRRAHLVQLTPAGLTAAHDHINQKVASLEGVLKSWSRDDLQTFAQLLDRFAQGLVNERHDA